MRARGASVPAPSVSLADNFPLLHVLEPLSRTAVQARKAGWHCPGSFYLLMDMRHPVLHHTLAGPDG